MISASFELSSPAGPGGCDERLCRCLKYQKELFGSDIVPSPGLDTFCGKARRNHRDGILDRGLARTAYCIAARDPRAVRDRANSNKIAELTHVSYQAEAVRNPALRERASG